MNTLQCGSWQVGGIRKGRRGIRKGRRGTRKGRKGLEREERYQNQVQAYRYYMENKRLTVPPSNLPNLRFHYEFYSFVEVDEPMC